MFTQSLPNHTGFQIDFSRNHAIIFIQFPFSRSKLCRITPSRFPLGGPLQWTGYMGEASDEWLQIMRPNSQGNEGLGRVNAGNRWKPRNLITCFNILPQATNIPKTGSLNDLGFPNSICSMNFEFTRFVFYLQVSSLYIWHIHCKIPHTYPELIVIFWAYFRGLNSGGLYLVGLILREYFLLYCWCPLPRP